MKGFTLALLFLLSPIVLISQFAVIEVTFSPSGDIKCQQDLIFIGSAGNVNTGANAKPSTNCGVLIQIFKEDSNELAFEHDIPIGTLNPGNSFPFNVRFTADTLGSSGNYYSKSTFYADANENPNNTTSERPFSVSACPLNVKEAEENFKQYIELNQKLGENQAGFMFPFKLPPLTTVESYDPSELEISNPFETYVAFIMSDVFKMFEQPTKILVQNANNGNIQAFDASWFTVINGDTESSFYDEWILLSENPFPVVPFNEIEYEEIDQIANNKTCAVLVSGIDNINGTSLILKSQVNRMKNDLMMNPYGPKLPEAQILTFYGISADSLSKELKKLETGYDTLYFYYTGHGSENKRIFPGKSYEESMEMSTLADLILATSATSINIILDNCYSGLMKEYIENNKNVCGRNVNLITSTDAEKLAGIVSRGSGLMIIGGHVEFSSLLLKCKFDLEADKDEDSRVSYVEAAKWVIEKNENLGNGVSIVQEQNPLVCVMEYDQSKVAESIIDNLIELYGEDYIFNSDIYADIEFNERIYKDIILGTNLSLPQGSGLIYVDGEPAKWMAHEGKTLTFDFDAGCELVEFNEEFFGSGFPPFPGEENTPPIFDDDNRIYEKITTEPIADFGVDTNDGEVIPPGEKACVLLISGYDPREEIRKTYLGAMEKFKEKLSKELGGEQLPEDNFRILDGIKKTDLLDTLNIMENQYNSVLIYFIGHSDPIEGLLLTGGDDNDAEFLSFEDLTNQVDDINAERYGFLLDTRYTTGFYKNISKGRLKDDNVYILALLPDSYESNLIFLSVNTFDPVSQFTYWLLSSYELSSDENGNQNGNIEFNEVHKQMVEVDNSETIYGGISREIFTYHPENNVTFELENIGIKVKPYGSNKDLGLSFQMNWADIQFETSNPDIDFIQPNIYWQGEILEVDDNLELNTTIEINTSNAPAKGMFDVVKRNFVVPTIVCRPDEDTEWMVLEGTLYDEAQNTFYNDSARFDVQFAIGYIELIDVNTIDHQDKNEKILINNPVDRILHIQLPENIGNAVKMEIRSLEGKLVLSKNIVTMQNQLHKIPVDHLNSGNYLLTVRNGNGIIANTKFIKI